MDTVQINQMLGKFKKTFNIMKAEFDTIVSLDNKVISLCLKEQVKLHSVWANFQSKINYLYALAETNEENYFAIAFNDIVRTSPVKLTATEVKIMVNTDMDYLDARKVLNKVYRYKSQVSDIVNLIESRKYILKDMTNLIVAGGDSYIL